MNFVIVCHPVCWLDIREDVWPVQSNSLQRLCKGDFSGLVVTEKLASYTRANRIVTIVTGTAVSETSF